MLANEIKELANKMENDPDFSSDKRIMLKLNKISQDIISKCKEISVRADFGDYADW